MRGIIAIAYHPDRKEVFKIEKYTKFRGYRGVKRVGYVSNIKKPNSNRLSNFILSEKEIRHDKRVEFRITDGVTDYIVTFPADFFNDSFSMNKFLQHISNYGPYYWHGTKSDFQKLKNYLYDL